MSRMTLPAILSAAVLIGCGATAARAECGGRTSIQLNETVESVARRCGINAEALKQANPGIGQRDFGNGGLVTVPRPALPSPQRPVFGNRGIVTVPSPRVNALR